MFGVARKREDELSDLQRDVLNALYWDLAVPRHSVKASVEDGWVILSGEVGMSYERRCAEADVLRVPGVVGVKNMIVVQSDEKAANP